MYIVYYLYIVKTYDYIFPFEIFYRNCLTNNNGYTLSYIYSYIVDDFILD